MTKLTDKSKTETDPEDKREGAVAMTQYRKRYEIAVEDSQYILIYAAGKCPKDINRETIEKLISARRRIETKQESSPREEADFWVAYQDIWKLVRPVTAESIKANLPMEIASTNILLRIFPALSDRFGTQTVVKSRRSVNRYIGFTAFVLLLLLLVQIYWVVGNQLTTQLAELLQQQTDLSLQISENQKEFSVIEILYQQNEFDSGKYDPGVGFTYDTTPEWKRDTLENLSTKARLENDQESIKSQQDRSFDILTTWSRLWNWLVITEDQTNNDKYDPQIRTIDDQIEGIHEQITIDGDGTQTAEALNSDISPQLNVINEQLRSLYAQNDELTLKQAELQGRIEAINNQLSDLSGDDTARTNRNADLEQQSDALEAQLSDLDAKEAVNREQAKGISAQLIVLAGDPAADQSLRSALESQLVDLDKQFLLLEVDKGILQDQKNDILSQLTALVGDETARQSREAELGGQLSELNLQLTDLETSGAIIGGQIQDLQSQSNDLLNRLIPPEQIVNQWNQELEQLTNDKNGLERQKLADTNREKSRKAQLAGKFVLDILQGYLLPLLYGVLGAATYVLRTPSRQIENVTYSEESGIQHLSRISLGALAGIMVGWFSFLITTSTFFGSVSPLAIAFLVGYNIELFFSWMDVAISKIKKPQKDAPASETENVADTPPAPTETPTQTKRTPGKSAE